MLDVMRKVRHYLVPSLLLRIALTAVVIIAILTGGTYLYVFNNTRAETLSDLEARVAERVRTESRLFELAEDNLSRFTEEFMRLYRSDVEVTEQQFWEMFFRGENGGVRLKRRYFDGFYTDGGGYVYGMSGFIGKNQSLEDPDFRRRLVLSYRVAARLGPAFQTRFANTHVSFPENGIILFWPEEPWGLVAEADLPMNELGTIAATLQENNPEREPVWTGLYFDETAEKWTITYEVPVDYQGRHLINPSHDVPLTQLIGRMVEKRSDGSYSFIVKYNGDLVAHPAPRPEAQKWTGTIKHGDIENQTVLAAYDRIRNAFPDAERSADDDLIQVMRNPRTDSYLAVASFHGPDWWFVRSYPRELVRAEAHESAIVVMVEGLLLLVVVLAVTSVVLQRQVGRPMGHLRAAADVLGEGRFDEVADRQVKLPTEIPNEVGLFASRFVEMAGNIRDAGRDLERIIEERTRELREANQSLRRLGLMDELTGIHNRRSFERDLQRLTEAVLTSGGVFALVMLDIDHFKPYNDTYGHAEGDHVLAAVGSKLRELTREDDRAYRYGGEEFAVLCTNASEEDAIVVARRMVEGVRALGLSYPESSHGIVTVSAGVAELDRKTGDAESLVKLADERLYRSKAAGRNRLTSGNSAEN